MDLLYNAYSASSDDDEQSKSKSFEPPPLKKPKFEPYRKSLPVKHHQLTIPNEAPIAAGRYISKRERATLAAAASTTTLHPNPPPTQPISSPVLGSISDSQIRHDILSWLRNPITSGSHSDKITEKLSIALQSHSKAVNALQWSKSHPHLLASAGMDHTICIWNVWNREKKARVLNHHTAAVKDVIWSEQGLSILSCGYDCSSRLIDVDKGLETHVFKEDQVVGVVKYHPNNSNLFLSGGSEGLLRLWDIRTGKAVHQYLRQGLGPILDVEFTNDTRQFISSSDVSKTNASESSIIVWDVSRQVPLSNQIYVEAYTCPSVRCHPSDPYFVAQSNGNYIAIFSVKPPFRLDKYKRYESHGVSGFPIKCNFSMDGEKLVSGSSDGCIYLYNTKTCKLIKKIKAYEEACIDVAFHPIIPNVIASCSWSGQVSVFE